MTHSSSLEYLVELNNSNCSYHLLLGSAILRLVGPDQRGPANSATPPDVTGRQQGRHGPPRRRRRVRVRDVIKKSIWRAFFLVVCVVEEWHELLPVPSNLRWCADQRPKVCQDGYNVSSKKDGYNALEYFCFVSRLMNPCASISFTMTP